MSQGYVVLSACRSGSTWLASLANASGTMGRCDEWLQLSHLDRRPERYTPDRHFETVMARATGANGRFGIKVFPAEFYKVRGRVGYDFVQRACVAQGATPIMLRRRDIVGQAISFVRAAQSRRWHSTHDAATRAPVYDFGQICNALSYLARSMQVWDSYCIAMGLAPRVFVYEDLTDDPAPYLDFIADSLGVDRVALPESPLSVMRDAQTEEWRARFLAQAGSEDIAALISGCGPAPRTLGNLIRFLRKRPMRPLPMQVPR